MHKVLIMFLNVHLYQQITVSGRKFFQWRRHPCVFLFVIDEAMILIREADMCEDLYVVVSLWFNKVKREDAFSVNDMLCLIPDLVVY